MNDLILLDVDALMETQIRQRDKYKSLLSELIEFCIRKGTFA